MDIFRLYPQYNQKSERRQQNVFVPFERRSGIDRRGADRPVLDKRLQNDIFEMKDVFKDFRPKREEKKKNEGLASLILSPIPYFRRFAGIEDAVKTHDYIKAGGKAFLQLINVREDGRDISKIFKKSDIPNDYQVQFSFIRGTPVESWDAKTKNQIIKKIDKTLDMTVLGDKFLTLLGKKKSVAYISDKLDEFGIPIWKYDKYGLPIIPYKIEGSLISKVVGRAMMRVPVLSIAFLSLLEIPSIIKSDNPVKQIAKSAISVTSVITGGAILGAIGAYSGGFGSLVGLGIGSYIGNKFANYLNSKI